MKESYWKYQTKVSYMYRVRLRVCHRVIVQMLADIFYEPTTAILNVFQSGARRA